MRAGTGLYADQTRRFLADLQEHWEKHGMSALDEVRQKFPDRYVDNYVMLARVIRLEADVKHSMAKIIAHHRLDSKQAAAEHPWDRSGGRDRHCGHDHGPKGIPVGP